MDDNNRISITVCGDGGCGMHFVARDVWEQRVADLSVCRKVFDYAQACSESVDGGVSRKQTSLEAPMTMLTTFAQI